MKGALFLVIAVAFSISFASKRFVWKNSLDSSMEYTTVCRAPSDCISVSRLIMGSDHLAQDNWVRRGQPQPTEDEIFAALDAGAGFVGEFFWVFCLNFSLRKAMHAGINLFDTSPIYVGGIEYTLGKWVRSRQQSGAVHGLNPDNRLYTLSKGGFPFDLYYYQSLPPGNHSAELIQTLIANGNLNASATPLPDGSIPLKNVPPGTYSSRLYGGQDEIVGRVSEEMGHSLSNLPNITIYLMHRDDGDYFRFNSVERTQTPVATIMSALSHPKIAQNCWAFGWSNWKTQRVEDSISVAKNTQFPLIFNSPYFSLLEMNITRSIHAGGVQALHDDMMTPGFLEGILFNPYSPLGGFPIFDQPAPAWETARSNAEAFYQKSDPYWQNVYRAIFTADNDKRFPRLVNFTSAMNSAWNANYTIDQVANAYALAHLRMDFLTIGALNATEVSRSVTALYLSKVLPLSWLELLYGK